MDNYVFSQYATKFRELKEKFLEQKLSDNDAAILAARLIDVQTNIPNSLYHHLKQGHDFVRYLFVGINLTIKKIELAKGKGDEPFLRLTFSITQGMIAPDIKLPRYQALLFLTLLCLKYKDFETDATGGFESEVDLYGAELANKIGLEYRSFTDDDRKNLNKTLLLNKFHGAVEKRRRKTRLSVPPNHISFSPAVREYLDEITGNALLRFEERYDIDL